MGTEIPVTEICRAEKSALPLFQRDAPSFLWKERRVRVAVPGLRITVGSAARFARDNSRLACRHESVLLR